MDNDKQEQRLPRARQTLQLQRKRALQLLEYRLQKPPRVRAAPQVSLSLSLSFRNNGTIHEMRMWGPYRRR